jgi:hypothetical protein
MSAEVALLLVAPSSQEGQPAAGVQRTTPVSTHSGAFIALRAPGTEFPMTFPHTRKH